MSGKIIVTRPSAGVVHIQIDNPPTNPLGAALRGQMLSELDALEGDLGVRAVVLTGQGKAFCSGDDLREAGARGEEASASLGQFGRLLNRVEGFRAPVIGAINGHAVGGGLELALCCDIRIGAPEAKFIAAGVNIGLMASVYRLPRLIGIARAKAMLLTGLPIDARTALEYGLLTEVVEAERLPDAAMALATRIASRAPLSVEATKRQAGRAFDLSPAEAGRAAGEELAVLSKSGDHRAGLAAFAARAEPVFTRT